MALSVRPFFKPRKVDPWRRMNRTHPYDIWGTLYRLAAYEKIKGEPPAFYTPAQIAALLFTNFNDLSDYDKQRVIRCKIDYALLFLRISHYITEDWEMPKADSDRPWHNPEPIYKKTYRVGSRGVFHIDGWSPDQVKRTTFSVMDEHWGKWIGRSELTFR